MCGVGFFVVVLFVYVCFVCFNKLKKKGFGTRSLEVPVDMPQLTFSRTKYIVKLFDLRRTGRFTDINFVQVTLGLDAFSCSHTI